MIVVRMIFKPQTVSWWTRDLLPYQDLACQIAEQLQRAANKIQTADKQPTEQQSSR